MLVDDSIDMTDDGLTPNEEEEDDSDPFAELVRNIPGGISSSTKLIPVTRDILGISTERQSQNAFGPFLHHAITPPASSTQSRPRHSSTSAASAIDQLTSPTIPISMSDIGVQTVASGDDDAPCCDAVTKLIRHLATHHSCSTSPYSGMLRSGTPPGGPRALLPPTPRS